jgi:cbb3-type cytochrome c oxidase subunit III
MSEAQILAAEPQVAQNVAGAPPAGGAAAQAGENGAGAKVFSTNCASCHGASGQGQPGVAPPLAGNPFVIGDPKAVIDVVENGLHGQRVMGQSYTAQMPSWKGTLSKKDIADVISYIRTSLNKGTPVKESDIP